MTCRSVGLWAALLIAPGLFGQSAAPGLETIRKTDLKADVFFLASDEMQGRGTATAENRLAATYIQTRFERLGIQPVGAGQSHLQPFELIRAELGRDLSLSVHVGSDAVHQATLGEEFVPEPHSATAEASGGVVFAGFGIVAPELDHDDYRDADVAGKIVLVLKDEPGERDPRSPFDGEAGSEHARPLRKTLAAQARGASAVLFVADVHNHAQRELAIAMQMTWPEWSRRANRLDLGAWTDQVRIPVAQISPELAERLVAPTGKTLAALARAAERKGGAAALPLEGADVTLRMSVVRERLVLHNVVGAVEGADPDLRNEWVVIGAHFDHIGVEDGRIFRGADDNASGVAGLLEIAEAFARAADDGFIPRRSILLAGWNAEEEGLLGAWAFTERPVVPLDRIAAAINIDMIGRDEEVPANGASRFAGLDPQTPDSNRNAVNVMGYSRSPDLKTAAMRANALPGLELRFRYDDNRSNLLRRSDHWPFLFHQVPAIFIHTGLHPDYHTEHDRPEKLHYEKMERIVQLVYQLSWDLAQADGRPGLNP